MGRTNNKKSTCLLTQFVQPRSSDRWLKLTSLWLAKTCAFLFYLNCAIRDNLQQAAPIYLLVDQ